MRLLVTGSRDWGDPQRPDAMAQARAAIDAVLAHYVRQAHALGAPRLTVVHGKALKGADNLAFMWVKQRQASGWPVEQEPHPANWNAPCVDRCQAGHRHKYPNGTGDYCPTAGFRRNQQMVDLGALVCVGFWRAGSSGTKDCLDRAGKAKIPLFKVLWADRENVLGPAWLAQHAPALGGVV